MRAIPREVDDAFVRDAQCAYAFGLWCADGYWWSSSIGLSNSEPELILRFGAFLERLLPRERLRLRIYQVPGREPDHRVLGLTEHRSVRPAYKMRRTAYHIYVNSRPLVRRFFAARGRVDRLPVRLLGPYFAGRFDGDGTFGATARIVYRSKVEAETDRLLLYRIGARGTSVLFYKKANEYCIYIHRSSLPRFAQLIEPYSWKSARRFTL